MKLGVNIDHIAVLREARKINDPDPIEALPIVKRAGADQITIHLREDRRHINDFDAKRIIEYSSLPVNMECSIDPDIIDIVAQLKPHRATLVPEKREEVTTEGGLDVIGQYERISDAIEKLKANEIDVSLFIDPDIEIIAACADTGADMVELHTGEYANIYAMLYSNLSKTPHSIKSLELSRKELQEKLSIAIGDLENAAIYAAKSGLLVAAGHGLNYQNVGTIAAMANIIELNIGQSIIARSIWDGLFEAVRKMKEIIDEAGHCH
ncbi:pyridoxine 5'-phosphate synthase [Nitratiruptor sp. SB155-2]|uniref:Pyridoxine 5'-phosphate synthase n=1 Tax=Nitratiruptor sp. (strain SB155-2) TaxID=387092 RepID=PDXJ_NITSB|nr:pyridoxine 5'-phosphate synthase [Nitratiruptor sp. SB155-2]A6Q3Y6.1 RecName: Full=Pyridoxine 5'-phosphate synthase; Short=PNP synthase [Nitratiruptor sp. SB155-2]BAF70195.1 pyridoxine 5-phosphate synthase [Nitratiruptor sp. SB155-2]